MYRCTVNFRVLGTVSALNAYCMFIAMHLFSKYTCVQFYISFVPTRVATISGITLRAIFTEARRNYTELRGTACNIRNYTESYFYRGKMELHLTARHSMHQALQ